MCRVTEGIYAFRPSLSDAKLLIVDIDECTVYEAWDNSHTMSNLLCVCAITSRNVTRYSSGNYYYAGDHRVLIKNDCFHDLFSNVWVFTALDDYLTYFHRDI